MIKTRVLFAILALMFLSIASFELVNAPSSVVIVATKSYVASATSYYIDGEVQNMGAQPQANIKIVATFYNSSGSIIGTSVTNDLNEIEPHNTRGFLVIYIDAQQVIPQIDHYSLFVSSSKAS